MNGRRIKNQSLLRTTSLNKMIMLSLKLRLRILRFSKRVIRRNKMVRILLKKRRI